MYALIADAVDESSGAYQAGAWVGRVVLLLIVVLLVRKYVFKK